MKDMTMRSVVRTLLVVFSLVLPGLTEAALDYRLDLRLIPERHQLEATARLDFAALSERRIQLRLAPRSEISSIRQGRQDLDYRFENGSLTISLTSDEPLVIDYSTVFDDMVATAPVHNEDPGAGVSGTISENGTYLSPAAAWYPQVVAENISYLLRIETPKGIEAVTSGERVAHEQTAAFTLSTWKIEYPVRGLTLSAGPYRIIEDHAGTIPIYAYFYPQSVDMAEVYLKESRNYLDLYEKLFGPYPFAHFSVVENFFPTGYGFPGWTLLGSTVIRLPFIVSTSLGHEIAHSWWGNGVRVDFRQGNWAEGLTTYVADYLYQEHKSADEARDYRLNQLTSYASLVNPENSFALEKFISRHDRASQAIGYGKAMMIFHMLRQQVGDEIFWRTLRRIAGERMFDSCGWDCFADAFSAAGGTDLAPFFRQWLTRTEGPRLTLRQVSTSRTDHGWLTRGILAQTAPVYQLQVAVRVSGDQEQTTAVVALESQEQSFSITTPWHPRQLVVDPDIDLFRIPAPEEIPSTVAAIRGSRQLLAVVADQYRPANEAQRTLLAALRNSGVTIHPLNTLSREQLAEHDLLIFGMDASLPEKGAAAGETFAPEPNQAVFLVRRNPYNAKRHAAWFLADGAAQETSVARKIPHYGRYSYLLFDAGEHLHSRIDPPPASPLRVILHQDH